MRHLKSRTQNSRPRLANMDRAQEIRSEILPAIERVRAAGATSLRQIAAGLSALEISTRAVPESGLRYRFSEESMLGKKSARTATPAEKPNSTALSAAAVALTTCAQPGKARSR